MIKDKPEYKVPLMSEIINIPWNEYKVISTFSGCGGSCTGYRMAGFKVIWANEFVPAAQNSYRANMEQDCILDCRDIKTVNAIDILNATKLKAGELDIFNGSPPCQAFSTAGKREKGWGTDKIYEHGAAQKNEELFYDYIRILKGLQPKIFIAENVSGLVKGTAKGFFLEILQGLKDCGYNVKAKLLDAQWLGVPQMRQRIIFIGVRNDIKIEPIFPKPLNYRYSVKDALPWIFRMDMGKGFVEKETVGAESGTDQTIGTSPSSGNGLATKVEACLVKVFHEAGGFSRTESQDRPMPAVTATQCRITIENESRIVHDSHKQFAIRENDGNKPSDCIPASPADSGHFQIENKTEKRKFTIAELKRICAFPDDFILTGSYAQQWERLGNSVPPIMMFHIAKIVKENILDKIKI